MLQKLYVIRFSDLIVYLAHHDCIGAAGTCPGFNIVILAYYHIKIYNVVCTGLHYNCLCNG